MNDFAYRQLKGLILLGIGLIGTGLLVWTYFKLPRWRPDKDLKIGEVLPEMPEGVFLLSDSGLKQVKIPNSTTLLLFTGSLDGHLNTLLKTAHIANREKAQFLIIAYQEPANTYLFTDTHLFRKGVRKQEYAVMEIAVDQQRKTFEVFRIQRLPRAMVIKDKKLCFITKPHELLSGIEEPLANFFSDEIESSKEELAETKILWYAGPSIGWGVLLVLTCPFCLIGLLFLPAYSSRFWKAIKGSVVRIMENEEE